MLLIVLTVFAFVLGSVLPVLGADFSIGDVKTAKVGQTLLMILVLAILLETGLSTLFNWRLFLLYGEGRGIKVPIAVAVAYLFVNQFNIDAIAEILSSFSGNTYPPGTGGKILTALIIAGGSSAVFSIFERFGIRNPLERRETAEKMRKKSHLKVQVTRDKVSRSQPITVKIDEEIVGVIEANRNRFGGIVGYEIPPGELKLEISGLDDQGNKIPATRTVPVAPGATVVESFQL
jgi:hypothetical protein